MQTPIVLTAPENFIKKEELTDIEIRGMYYYIHEAYNYAIMEQDGEDSPAMCETIDDTERMFQFAPSRGNIECCYPIYYPGFEQYGTVSHFYITDNHLLIAVISDDEDNYTYLRLN